MKRIFAGLCAVLLLTAGCAVQDLPGKTANRMAGGFTAEVTVTNAESEAKATLLRYGTDAWSVIFNEPAQLSGVQLDFVDDEVKASYKGLEFSVPQSAQALRTELAGLMEAVDSMAQSAELNGKTEDGNLVCEGELDAGGYSLTFAQDGVPLSFLLPSYGVTVIFDSFAEAGGDGSPEPSASTEPDTAEPAVTETIPEETAAT